MEIEHSRKSMDQQNERVHIGIYKPKSLDLGFAILYVQVHKGSQRVQGPKY